MTRRIEKIVMLCLLLLGLAGGAVAQTPFTQNDLAGTVFVHQYTPPAGQDAMAQLGGGSLIQMGTNFVPGQPNCTTNLANNRNNGAVSPVALPGTDCKATTKFYFGSTPPDYTTMGPGFADNPASFADGRGYFGEIVYNGSSYAIQIERVDDFVNSTRSQVSGTAAPIPAPASNSIGQLTLETKPGGVFVLSYTSPSASPVIVSGTDTTFSVSRAAIQELSLSGAPLNMGLGSFSAYQVTAGTSVQSVSVSPSSPTVSGGQTQQFTATVNQTGGAATTVTWSANIGTITSSGLWTAPAASNATQTATITATSTADPTKSGTATATVPLDSSILQTVFSLNGVDAGGNPSSNVSVLGTQAWEGNNGTGVGSMQGTETQLRGTFTGTKLEWNTSNAGGTQNNYASIDGGAGFNLAAPGANTPTWLTVASGLTDTVHTFLISQGQAGSYLYYGSAFRVTGHNPAMGPTSMTGAAGINNIVNVGDSRTAGQGATAGYNTHSGTSYPAALLSALGSGYDGQQEGIPGKDSTTWLLRYTDDVASQYGAANKTNTIIYWGGYNDLAAGASQAQIEAYTQQYVTQAHARGFKVLVGTVPDGTQSTNRDAVYNSWLLSGASGADKVSDIAALPQLAYPPSSTYWYSDSVHFVDAGNQAIANQFKVDYLAMLAAPPTLTLSSVSLSSSGVTFTASVTSGTSPFTYTLSRPGMTAITNTTGTLTDSAPVANVLNLYTLTVTDSETTPVTKTIMQAVVPIGTYVPSAPKRRIN